MTWTRDPDPRRGRGLGAALLTVCAALLGSASTASAAEPPPAPVPTSVVKTDNLTLKAKLDPEKPLAGAKGVLVVELELRKTVHVYADKRFKTLPVEAKGLTWGKAEVTEPLKWVDPALGGEPEEVWFDKATVKIPFELAADVAFPVQIASNFRWSCCDEGTCYPPETTKNPVGFTLTASGVVAPDPVAKKEPTPAAPAMADPAPAPALPAMDEAAPPAAPPAMDPAPAPKEPPPEPPPVAIEQSPPRNPSTEFDGKAARVSVVAAPTEVRATVAPHEGWHVYAPGTEEGKPVEVTGTAASGVTWQEAVYPKTTNLHVTEPFEVKLPYQGTPSADAPLQFTVGWQSCSDDGICHIEGENFAFDGARVWRIEKKAPAPKPPPATAGPGAGGPAAGAIPATGLLFPAIGAAPEESEFGEMWKKWGLLILGWLFLTGVVLAFTPCVLPIIPITVSIIGGGAGNVSRKRLSVLLSFYVLGLSLAFGTMGVVSAVTGGAMSAAFQSPTAIWVIAGIFFLLALGMFGIYELQPPQWMQRMQGGAKGGNVVGAFLFGAMAAVIASPCTGPVIVSLVVFTAQSGNAGLGFLLFFTLGLGMGAVFFAAGSLNLVMRPGPWMVWVRYAFGIILVGAALYYLAHSGRLVPPMLFVVGFAIALGVGAAIVHHLVKAQGQEIGSAGGQAAKIAVLLIAATGFVAWITKEPTYTGSGQPLEWTAVTTREQLVAEVEKAKRDGKPVLFDIRADWCTYCVAYENLMNSDEELHSRLGHFRLLHLDKSKPVEGEPGLREGLGLPPDGQPMMAFVDAQGRLRSDLQLKAWKGASSSAEMLKKRLDALVKPPATAP